MKLLKHLKKKNNLNVKNNTEKKQEHTDVKKRKKWTDDKGFLMQIKATCG